MSQIHELLPKVMADVGHIAKAGYNEAQGYAFMSYGDVASACQKAFAEHGISVGCQVLDLRREERQTRSGSTMTVTLLTVRYSFGAPDGSHVEVDAVGEGADSGDKATNKAMTAALKYALRTLLVIPDNEDGDAESPEVGAKKPPRKVTPLSGQRGSGTGSGQASSPAPAGDANDPWLDLLHNPGGWFDNRADKKNPKAPDFKAKNGNPHWGQAGEPYRGKPAGLALWLRDAPPHWEEAFNAGDPSLMTADGPTGRGATVADAVAALGGQVIDEEPPEGEEPF